MKKGKLYLIPTLLGETAADSVLPKATLDIIFGLDHFIVENLRSARRFLSKTGNSKMIDEIHFELHDKHYQASDLNELLKPILQGIDMGLMSEAGTPCVADPGGAVVALAHQMGIQVVPLTGPNAILMALMASGFNGQAFSFHGYLPIQSKDRINSLKMLEKRTLSAGETQIFIETPFRNNALIESILQHCLPETLLCVAAEISTKHEKIISKRIKDWQSISYDYHKKPCVFLLWHESDLSTQKKQARKHSRLV
ncbi:MAG: SAM-dependent methyltransferase [Bacteroidetes bacterium]|jgi:16S rRNA (cytidine1402-2'-O)-methyltransferase|nr:SAM-dependent methyltransferase [Bacteroidota bacterium]